MQSLLILGVLTISDGMGVLIIQLTILLLWVSLLSLGDNCGCPYPRRTVIVGVLIVFGNCGCPYHHPNFPGFVAGVLASNCRV
jgi:hypothetical protein